MKKITLLIVMFTSFVYSQDSVNGTTFEEYNYMIKGYKISLDSGLDTKKGYHIGDIDTVTVGAYVFNFKNFIRVNTGDSAGIIVVATSLTWGNVYYLSIPINNPELLADFNLKVDLWDESMTTAYSTASTYMFSNFYNYYNKNKFKSLKN